MPIVPILPALPAAAMPMLINPRPRRRSTVSEQSPVSVSPPLQAEPGYEVGYKKPPILTRFPKNTSGNKRGRPKGAKGLKTLVRELLTQKVKVRTSSGLKTMTKMEAMLHKILEQAFSGNLRALQAFVVLYQQAVPDETATTGGQAKAASIAELDDHDRAMLDELRSTIAAELGDGK